jgi:hypothetical protein
MSGVPVGAAGFSAFFAAFGAAFAFGVLSDDAFFAFAIIRIP